MTWLSRLLPQSPRLPRLADHNHRTRQAQRRRRISTLEALEGRTLLSNVVTSVTTASNGARTLTITGDTHNDTFTVTENNATGQITVTGTGSTLIDTNGRTYTTTQEISNLAIVLPGNAASTDLVTITSTGTGKGFLSTVNILAPGVATPNVEGLNLTLNVSNLTVGGELSLWDAPTFVAPATPSLPIVATASGGMTAANAPTAAQIPGYTPLSTNNYGGGLTVSVTGSHLGSLYVEQTGSEPAVVTVNQDAIGGSVTVEEGVANGDKITLENSTAGATTLIQGYGPTQPGDNGSGNLISVQDDGSATSGIFDLAITQLGTGGGQQILVGTVSPVEVALGGFGIEATQSDTGGTTGNLIAIESITTYSVAPFNSFGPSGPPDIVTVQGNGGSDKTTIDNVGTPASPFPGNITVTQGNGGSDKVDLEADVVGFTTPSPTLSATGSPQPGPQSVVLKASYGVVKVTQGNGNGDIVTLGSSGSEGTGLNYFNDLTITQGNGGGQATPDIVSVDSTVVVTGNITVVQGDGAFDQVFITSTTAGYVTSTGFPGLYKDHGGLLTVIQGNGYEDSINITSLGLESPPDFGSIFNYVLLIQGDSLNGNPLGTPNSLTGYSNEITGDTVTIDETLIYSNLSIYQNTTITVPTTPAGYWALATTPVYNVGDGPGFGYNIVSIGTGAATYYNAPSGTVTGPSQVLVGGETNIDQGSTAPYGVNEDFLGGAGDASGTDFETLTLDIWTGAGGGGFVSADNTTVVYGSGFGFYYVIDGGGDGNGYFDSGGNYDNGNSTLLYNTDHYSG